MAHVLVIDNDPRTRETVCRALQSVDVEIVPAEWTTVLTLLETLLARQQPAPAGTDDSKTHAMVRKALRILESRFSDQSIGLRAAARHVGVSPWHLARVLKRATGVGFHHHLHRMRVAEARELLRHSDRSIKEIAYASGYADTRSLDRHFKRRVGVTPTAFRRLQHLDSVGNAAPSFPIADTTRTREMIRPVQIDAHKEGDDETKGFS